MTGNSAALLSAGDVAAMAGRYAEDGEASQVLSPEVAKALVAAGFARHFVPLRWGGTEGGVADLLTATTLVARECVSAAWCAALAAGAARMGAFLPEQGQAELWADGPDAFVAGALIPVGNARTVADGWRLTGRWDFSSGVDHSDWALVACPVRDGELTRSYFFAVPRSAYTIAATWSSVGMRGTGSNTLILDDVFVPRHRAFDREEMMRGRPIGSTAACHAVPLRAVSGILFAAPALGAARGAWRAWAQRVAERAVAGGQAPRNETAHLVAARAAGEIDMAELLLKRVAETCDRGEVDAAAAARHPFDCALAVDVLVGVVERLFRAAGSRGQLPPGPLQRFWRDVHCLASHTALQLEPAGAGYGAHLLGGDAA